VQAVTELLRRWNGVPTTVRFGAAALGAVVLIAAVAATLAAHPSRVPLFPAPLHAEQLSEVEERLAAWNVAFTPSADNVVVDSRRRNDLLLRLSLAGVPHAHLSSTGEALAGIGVLTPQAVIEAQTRAGLAGDIEASLRGIEGIDDARVIIAPAKAAEFGDDAPRDASASVRLRLRPGAQLSRETIAGIRSFVAASVAQLEPARVTILDDRGVAPADGATNSDDAAGLQRSLQSALDAAFGEGAAIVRVRAEYETARTAARDLHRSPLGTTTHESLAQTPPGALRRLTAAVFVDQSRALDLDKVRELAAATVGYDVRRGDALAVEAVDFRHEPPAREDGWRIAYGLLEPLAPAAIVVIGLIACVRAAMPSLATLVSSLVERGIVERTSKAAAGFPPARVRSMLEQEPPHAAAAIISALPAATATAVLELYPPHEREAIVARMQRAHSPLLPDAHELLRRHA